MRGIERRVIDGRLDTAGLWHEVARQTVAALQQRGCALRDAVVLLPFAALLRPAREAFARQPGWQPRIETALTLAATLGPPAADDGAAGPVGDGVIDRLQVLRLLHEAFGNDVPAPTMAADLVVQAAHALLQAASATAPDARATFWAQVHETGARPTPGPGSAEAALLGLAVTWAGQAAAPPTDRLFTLRPGAWVVVRVGGPDRLAESVLHASTCGGLLFDLDPDADEPFAGVACARVQIGRPNDLESEALATAAAVIEALKTRPGAVGVVAVDRLLIRRVQALLQRAGVGVDDETGWRLSTTPAAARVLARLRAALETPATDAWLDWLKRWPPAEHRATALEALEARWRRRQRAPADDTREAADALLALARRTLQAWTGRARRSLAAWTALHRAQLQADGEWARLAGEDSGAQLIAALHLDDEGAAWHALADDLPMSLQGYQQWIETTLESVTVQRDPQPGARVVLTPLARAIGRPFDTVVLAGADSRHFGRPEAGASLIGDALAQAAGLDRDDEAARRQRLALAQLLRVPNLQLSWRSHDADSPLGPAADVEWLLHARAAAGQPAVPATAAVPRRLLTPRTCERPAPAAGQALPRALSASAVEALRDCPYRFFARAVLRLDEGEELEAAPAKRHYGDWLHATLHLFHLDRPDDAGRSADEQRLRLAADQALSELDLDGADMWPYRAGLDDFVATYLDWLAVRERAGWRWHTGEQTLEVAPPDWAPQVLRGRIDRVDRGPHGAVQILDYKTGQAAALKKRAADPLEDTQLAFYAALWNPTSDDPLSAAYVALDEAKGIQVVDQPGVTEAAAALIDGVGSELHRLREGVGLPALGEGRVCETCEARGLCRRDQWGGGGIGDGPGEGELA